MQEELKNFTQTLYSEEGVHQNTIISYKYDINQFNNFIKKKNKSFRSVLKKDIISFLESLSSKKLKNKSKSRKIFALKKFFKFLISEKIIINNPMEKIDIPRSEDTISVTLNTEQIKKVLNFVSNKIDNYLDCGIIKTILSSNKHLLKQGQLNYISKK